MSEEPKTTVTVPRWALEFVMENACFMDKGPLPEGWCSEEMNRARAALDAALEESTDTKTS